MMHRDLQFWRSAHVAQSLNTGTVGDAVSMRDYISNTGAFQIRVPKALAAAVTVSFEGADADPANDCLPGATWTPLQANDGCFSSIVMTYVANPADPGYSAATGNVCFIPIQCRPAFVRAVLSAASPGLTVDVVGPAQERIAS